METSGERPPSTSASESRLQLNCDTFPDCPGTRSRRRIYGARSDRSTFNTPEAMGALQDLPVHVQKEL